MGNPKSKSKSKDQKSKKVEQSVKVQATGKVIAGKVVVGEQATDPISFEVKTLSPQELFLAKLVQAAMEKTAEWNDIKLQELGEPYLVTYQDGRIQNGTKRKNAAAVNSPHKWGEAIKLDDDGKPVYTTKITEVNFNSALVLDKIGMGTAVFGVAPHCVAHKVGIKTASASGRANGNYAAIAKNAGGSTHPHPDRPQDKFSVYVPTAELLKWFESEDAILSGFDLREYEKIFTMHRIADVKKPAKARARRAVWRCLCEDGPAVPIAIGKVFDATCNVCGNVYTPEDAWTDDESMEMVKAVLAEV